GDHLVPLDELPREGRADEAGAAGDEDPLALEHPGKVSLVARSETQSSGGPRYVTGATGTTFAASRADGRSAAPMKRTAPNVIAPASTIHTAALPSQLYTGPTTSRPSGEPTPLAVITAVMTFWRSESGGRVEMMPINGAFTNGTSRPVTASAAQTTSHGTSNAIAHSGSVTSAIAADERVSGLTRSSSFTTSTEPITAPMPKAVKTQPAMCGFR